MKEKLNGCVFLTDADISGYMIARCEHEGVVAFMDGSCAVSVRLRVICGFCSVSMAGCVWMCVCVEFGANWLIRGGGIEEMVRG